MEALRKLPFWGINVHHLIINHTTHYIHKKIEQDNEILTKNFCGEVVRDKDIVITNGITYYSRTNTLNLYTNQSVFNFC